MVEMRTCIHYSASMHQKVARIYCICIYLYTSIFCIRTHPYIVFAHIRISYLYIVSVDCIRPLYPYSVFIFWERPRQWILLIKLPQNNPEKLISLKTDRAALWLMSRPVIKLQITCLPAFISTLTLWNNKMTGATPEQAPTSSGFSISGRVG